MTTRSISSTPLSADRAIDALLWVLQFGLMAWFLRRGFQLAILGQGELYQEMPWTLELPYPLIRFVGYLELMAAVMLCLPGLLRIFPALVQFSAGLLAFLNAPAVLIHFYRGESAFALRSLGLIAFCAAVAWGRHSVCRIEPRI